MASRPTTVSQELTRAIARYHAGCLRVIGAQGVAMRDVRTTKRAALCVDVGSLTEREDLLTRGETTLSAPSAPDDDSIEAQSDYERRHAIWGRLRELTAKAAVEAHTKEVLYAGPLLHGYRRMLRSRKFEPVLAPLFVQGVTLTVTNDGSILVQADDESPRFNTALWTDTVSDDDAKQIVDRGIEAQADLASGYDAERVSTLLEAVAAIVPYVVPGGPEWSA